MNSTFADFLGKFLLIYLDDITIYSPNRDQHKIDINHTLARLDECNFKLIPSKCHFFKETLQFLGHVITGKGILPDPGKVSALLRIISLDYP